MGMEQLRLSPSRIAEFNNCPQLYKYRVIDQLPEPPSLDAERGTLVHSILHDLFGLPRDSRTFESAYASLPSLWQKQQEEKPELSGMITSQKEWNDRVLALLNTYFLIEDPKRFDATYREIHLEYDLSHLIYIHGYVDRIDVAPSGEVRIVDYKTGKSPKPGWEEKALFQLKVYAYLYFKKHAELPKLLQLIYLGDGRIIKSSPLESDLNKVEAALHKTADEIIQSRDRNSWPPKPSRLCDWCYFKKICPAFNS